MQSVFVIVLLLELAAVVLAKQCTNIMIPVSITARQGLFSVDPVVDNLSATTFAYNLTTNANGGNFTNTSLAAYRTLRGSYQISARFCSPDAGINDDTTVQVLIHGIGFDKSYWDLSFNNYAYSYEDSVVDQYSFCTLAIDRLGIGASSHGEPLNEIQAPATVATIYELTTMLRKGTIPGVPHKFTKVIHVGHSFGSFLSYFLSILHPTASDGLVLTGFSMDPSWFGRTIAGWGLHVARLNQPLRFGSATLPAASILTSLLGGTVVQLATRILTSFSLSITEQNQILSTTSLYDLLVGASSTPPPTAQNLPPGYLTWSDLPANIYAFLYHGHFDPNIAPFAESTKQPVTLGELLTIGVAPSTSPFKGPVLVVTGRQDNIYCGGDCLAVTSAQGFNSTPDRIRTAFPHAASFEAQIPDGFGHGINFHYGAPAVYTAMSEWAVEQGF